MRRDPIVLGQNYILSGSDIGKKRPNAIRIVIDDTVHYQRTKILIKSIVSNKDEWRLCVSIKFICMK